MKKRQRNRTACTNAVQLVLTMCSINVSEEHAAPTFSTTGPKWNPVQTTPTSFLTKIV
jgi:hypothetical protein